MCKKSPFARWRFMKLTQLESMFPSMSNSSRSIPWSDLITNDRSACELEQLTLRNRRSLNSSGLNGSMSTRICCTSSVNRWRLGSLSRNIKRYSLVVSFGQLKLKLISCGFDLTNIFVYLSNSQSGSKLKPKWRRDGIALLSLKENVHFTYFSIKIPQYSFTELFYEKGT